MRRVPTCPRLFVVTFLAVPLLGLATLAWPAADANAATITVGNCNDSGSGSLRAAVATALSGDTIDMTGLTCSRIVLTSGEIVVPQRSLHLIGRSRSALTIDGNDAGRVFRHTHIGRFRLTQVTIANGRASADERDGGCIHSDFGEVELVRARIQSCVAPVRGGAIYARVVLMTDSSAAFNLASGLFQGQGGAIWGGTVRVLRSQIYDNRAWFGGAIYSGFNEGGVSLSYSLIKDNIARMEGGGLYVDGAGSVTINKSTLVNNRSQSDDAEGGAIYGSTWDDMLITDSTISGNRAATRSAVSTFRVRIYNSTIAFNVETFECDAAIPAPYVLSSSIIARNTCLAGQGYDVNEARFYAVDNLVERARFRVASGTIVADPRLAPLANNGGPTPTHALMADSPAIDRGNNGLQREYDQRGPGFPRVRGAFPDIGAFER